MPVPITVPSASPTVVATTQKDGYEYQVINIDVGGPGTEDILSKDDWPIAAGFREAVKATAVTVGVTAIPLPATPLTNRKSIEVQNLGLYSIYIGGTGVTTSAGREVLPGASWSHDVGAAILFAISTVAGQDVRVLEFS